MILVFDTETSTFPNPNVSATHPSQARILQLAWLMLDDKFQEVGCFNSLIRIPTTVQIAEGAYKQHGIDGVMCDMYGMGIETALNAFTSAASKCDTLIAHNIPFDLQLIDIEHEILFGERMVTTANQFCTMRTMTPICRLAHLTGRKFGSEFKWPKLKEAYKHCFGKEFDKQHDALADVRATAAVYKWLKNRERQVCPPTTTLTT